LCVSNTGRMGTNFCSCDSFCCFTKWGSGKKTTKWLRGSILKGYLGSGKHPGKKNKISELPPNRLSTYKGREIRSPILFRKGRGDDFHPGEFLIDLTKGEGLKGFVGLLRNWEIGEKKIRVSHLGRRGERRSRPPEALPEEETLGAAGSARLGRLRRSLEGSPGYGREKRDSVLRRVL